MNLADKLGIKPGMNINVINCPESYDTFLSLPILEKLVKQDKDQPFDFIHIFIEDVDDIEGYINKIEPSLHKHGVLWISWPTEMDISNKGVQEYIKLNVFKNGLVDRLLIKLNLQWYGIKIKKV